MYFHFIPRKGAKMIMTMLDVKDKNPRHHINSPSSQRQYVMASALVVQVSQRHKVFFGGKGFCGIIKGVTNCPKVNQTKNPLLKAEKKIALFLSCWSKAYQVATSSLAPRKQWHYVRAHVKHQTLDAGSLKLIDLRGYLRLQKPGSSPQCRGNTKKTSAESLRKTSLVWKGFKSRVDKIKVFFGIWGFFWKFLNHVR